MTGSLELRHLALRVPDLERSVAFYRDVGFAVARRGVTAAELSIGAEAAPILSLLAAPDAEPARADSAGLFHAALLLPSRPALGGWLQRAAERELPFAGFSDHGVSEAIYFSDPDGNGLEFYADRPSTEWPRDGDQIAMVTRPLDLRGLLASAKSPADSPLAGARWGHLHLRVTDLDRAERFYTDELGLAVTQRTYPGARFLAADGYHHHVGLNVWGRPTRPQPRGALGLASATFALAHAATPVTRHDPDGIELRLTPPNETA